MHNHGIRRNGLRAALFAPVVFTCAIATAQPGSGQPPSSGQDWEPAQPKPQAQQFEAATVDAFVDVFGDINEIRQEYSQQIRNAEDQETARNLQREAQQEMMQTVQSSDIDVDTYNAEAYPNPAVPRLHQDAAGGVAHPRSFTEELPMAVRKTSLTSILLLTGWLSVPAMAADERTSSDADQGSSEAPTVEPATDSVNRITMARFARAFGVLTRDTPPEELVGEQDVELDADALRKALAESGLERRDWDELLQRMREDQDFRKRVETLSASYRLGQ